MNSVLVTVTTAIELSSKQAADIEKAVAKAHSSELRFEYKVDPSVLGGIRLTIGSQELDGTVRAKLEAVKAQLLTNL